MKINVPDPEDDGFGTDKVWQLDCSHLHANVTNPTLAIGICLNKQDKQDKPGRR